MGFARYVLNGGIGAPHFRRGFSLVCLMGLGCIVPPHSSAVCGAAGHSLLIYFGQVWHLYWQQVGSWRNGRGWIPGTFDVMDLVLYVVAAAVSYWVSAIR